MAKRKSKVLPGRKSDRSREEDSLLIRSAESLGRVIGTLQRQVQGSSKRVADLTEDAINAMPDLDDLFHGGRKRKSARKSASRKTSTSRSGGRKRATSGKTSSRARVSTGTKRTASRKTSRKRTRR